jgi:predicted Zn-dependent protease with MMP-like domain
MPRSSSGRTRPSGCIEYPGASRDQSSAGFRHRLDDCCPEHGAEHLRTNVTSSGRRDRIAVYREAQRRYRPDRRQFEQLVLEALETLPNELKARIENVAIVVEDEPPVSQSGESLLGLYEGIALTDRGESYHLAPPDRITIFRRAVLAAATTRDEVRREIHDTVVHEIGHYFGLAERELP